MFHSDMYVHFFGDGRGSFASLSDTMQSLSSGHSDWQPC